MSIVCNSRASVLFTIFIGAYNFFTMSKLKTQDPIVFNGINTQITLSKILVQSYTSQVL